MRFTKGISLLALVLAAGYLFVVLTTKFWNGKDKFGFVFFRGDEVRVTVLDPKLEEMTVLVIPGDTQVEVARNYGTLRLKNVWQLGINEKLDGDLLAGTVTKNLLFPVFLWSSSDTDQALKFIFFPGKTNIPFGDRLSASLFAMRVGGLNKVEIDLAKSQFLQKGVLTDGQAGYRINRILSERLTVYFADDEFSERGLKVYIKDTTGVFGVAEKVGEILEVMGGKVVAVDKGNTNDADCEILAKDVKVAKKIARLFACRIAKDETDFDLEMRIGKKFAQRF